MHLPRHSQLEFPDPRSADADGLVAVGGDLSPSRLLAAYRRGIFPWTANPVSWWSPDPRGIFELDQFRMSASLERVLRRKVFNVTRNRAFGEVMAGCAERAKGRESTWITSDFIQAYMQLHKLGHAHSVECWQDGELAGGIYGVVAGGLFAGESMFHRVSNASKVALHHLVMHLRERGFVLFDIQMVTPATRQVGAVEISRTDYLRRLAAALELDCDFGGRGDFL
ncbi:MAG TPA: leucyl/phenylalanyl-tRNA--protein transferase [Verrucomicrobiae bacterium]|jgi:leucyl/phenylalanyl-tRNA--protein transferase|nr:leucyl/phenylalanyl-tRNA--protein transferase [Verrucomicrobiae bacterium]